MENKDWLDDYMSLKQVNPSDPFTVPSDYFDDLEGRIEARKNLSELIDRNLPEGFVVPDNYFAELTGIIQSRIAIEEVATAANNGFVIPEGYFENLQLQIQSRVFIEETLGEPIEQFSVPEGYFNQLNKAILDKTVYVEQAKRNGIVRKLITSTAFKYATAACFAVAIGGGILLNSINNDPVSAHKKTFLHKQLSAVPVDDIKNYLQLNEDAGDTQQTAAAQGAAVDDNKLIDALQQDADSIQ